METISRQESRLATRYRHAQNAWLQLIKSRELLAEPEPIATTPEPEPAPPPEPVQELAPESTPEPAQPPVEPVLQNEPNFAEVPVVATRVDAPSYAPSPLSPTSPPTTRPGRRSHDPVGWRQCCSECPPESSSPACRL
jgi:hypothetical protein